MVNIVLGESLFSFVIMLQAKPNCEKTTGLTQQLRRFSAEHVKINKEDTHQTKHLVDSYLKNGVLRYIFDNSQPLAISKLEYTGSLYERLKTEAADEVDVMVVLQTDKQEVILEDAGVPGFVLLKLLKDDSPLKKYTNTDGYIIPDKLRASWFFGLVQKAVNELVLQGEMKVRSHGPAVQLDITDSNSGKKLSADLVPTFQIGTIDYFVAKSYTGSIVPACDCKLLWRKSFSLMEKARLQEMDKEDHGCRHELLRIIKSIIRGEATFAKLKSYHLKTAFLRYNSNSKVSWDKDQLGERFIEYLESLYAAVNSKNMNHFWVEGINLLDNIPSKTLENMADRLRKILDSDKERNKVLKCQIPVSMATNDNRAENCPVTSPGKPKPIQLDMQQTPTDLLQVLRRFLDSLGTVLSEDAKWSKEVIEQVVKDGLLKYCKEKSDVDLLSKFEYGGSLFENLKTKHSDGDDAVILLVLKGKKGFIDSEVNDAGYAGIKATEGSPYKEFSNPDGFLVPVKFQNWLFKLISKAVQSITSKGASTLSLKASNSSGLKVCISEQSKALEVQLVPTFQLDGEYFVPSSSQHGYLPTGVAQDTAWIKSYTLMQKALLKDMDKDQGCRHSLFKVVNTVLHKEATFSPLTSFLLKMCLLWYNKTTTDWGQDSLAEHFTGFVTFLRDALQKKEIQHFWIQELNLLTNISPKTLENMHTRLSRILNSEQERRKILNI
ncbi:Mitochondrial dynamics protein MID51 [Stylophora pistillata]|uniref:Mitochondrial dynamics protein MID51 n=1 Tax=Stylophora pistillata TaxID=50429 RepID=A0A2B4RSQ9_STYPI|nr:Mitochondrial dynamics protein MID51 [Stylophora pistillata]